VNRGAVLCAVLCLVFAGCGDSSKTDAPPSSARNEADWSEAKAWARRMVEPLEASLGVAQARQHEGELARAHYETLVARERATPEEGREAEEEP
jgi:hypothetical protein